MLDPEDTQRGVHDAVVGEQEAPDQRVTDHRGDHWDEENDAQDPTEPLRNALEPVAQADRDHEVERRVAGRKHDGVTHDCPERGVRSAEHALVVVDSDETATPEERPVEERDHEGRDQRQDDEQQEAGHARSQVDEGAHAVAALTRVARLLRALRGLRFTRIRRARWRLAAGCHSVSAHQQCHLSITGTVVGPPRSANHHR